MKIATFRIVLRLIKGYALVTLLLIGKWLSRLLWGKKLYQKQLRFLVRKTQLFDSVYYLENNIDVSGRHVDPLNHYVKNGDKEGRYPMPFFDPRHYRSQVKSKFKFKGINSLLHYAYIGRYLGFSPSPWFDVKYYLKENKDVARSGIDPLLHYLKWGGIEGRSPTILFDGSYYLRKNPDVKEARVNPLLHYLRIGRFEGRPTSVHQSFTVEQNSSYKKVTERLQLQQQKAFLPRQNIVDAKIDVIVPIYRNQALSLYTLYSVLQVKVDISFELIVINDASPEPELVTELGKLHDRKLITLLHNPKNQGFVYTVNRGVQLHSQRDVVLLNSDTEVFDHWLDKLYAAAYRQSDTGTVTPLSNNATICSYPNFLQDNPYPLELNYALLDKLATSVNQNIEVEAPTGVGFCMYLRRDCVNAVGLFDEITFGRGYGEENDFCQRAIKHGWRNIITADTFVRHWGGASFQGEKAERVSVALAALARLHPDYRNQVDQFIKQDPLAQAREHLDWARLRKQVKQRNVLIVCHNRGGGSERHLQEDAKQLLQAGLGVFYLRPLLGKPTHVKLSHLSCSQLPNLNSYVLEDTETLALALAELGITRIHTHGLVDFTIHAPEHVLKLVKRLKVEFWVDLHDYKVICPRINLADRNGRYCGEVDCHQCCKSEGNDFGATDIVAWRQMHHSVLQQADKIFVPSLDMKNRLLNYFPDISLSVSPHEQLEIKNINITFPKLKSNCKLRIVVIGGIGKIKGFDILNACAADAKKRKLPLEFVILGYSVKDEVLERSHVMITGRYLEQEAPAKLNALSPHVVWLPSTWPETYSYTLSLALNGGYPTFAFDIGAIADRLREVGQEDNLMPLEMQDSPREVNDRFVNYLTTCQAQLSVLKDKPKSKSKKSD